MAWFGSWWLCLDLHPVRRLWLAIAQTFLKTKVQTIDCLQACRFDLVLAGFAWWVAEKSRQRAMAMSLQLSHSRAGFAVTPIWPILCLHNCSLHGCCTGWLSSLWCCQSIGFWICKSFIRSFVLELWRDSAYLDCRCSRSGLLWSQYFQLYSICSSCVIRQGNLNFS